MASSREVIDEEDVAMMDLNELKRTSKDIDVDPDELTFPSMQHHMTVRGKLETLVDRGVIDFSDMDDVYGRWKESKA